MKLDEIRQWSQSFGEISSPDEKQKLYEYLLSQGHDMENLYQELEMSSRYVNTHVDVSGANGSIQLHSHSFYEILFCCASPGVEYLLGAERYRIETGDIICVPPGVSHCPLLPEHMSEPYKRYVLWFSPEFKSLLTQFSHVLNPPEVGLLRTTRAKWKVLENSFRNGVLEAQRKAPGWEAAVIGNTISLLALLYRAILDESLTPPQVEKPELLDQVVAYVEFHLSKEITLADTARQFYVSQSTISQIFRNKMGVSFYHFVIQRRLIAAKTLIESGLSMEAVAEQVGFSDYSAFYRAFRQEYGISPKQYRKLQSGNAARPAGAALPADPLPYPSSDSGISRSHGGQSG